MPTRVVTGGVGVLPGATMAERRKYLMTERDDLRRLLMHEPRGHSAMSGAILQPPVRSDADMGVVFIEVSGCLPMCGHGAIGTATVLVEMGLVPAEEPVTTVRLDTPAGLVEAVVDVNGGHAGAVTLRNVASYLHLAGAVVDVSGLGRPLTVDVAWGGNFYAILPASRLGLEVCARAHNQLVDAGLRILNAVNEQLEFAHPDDSDLSWCRHVLFTAPGCDGAAGRAAVVISPGWIDRSPCGTGTSARMAQLHARGQLELGEAFVHESIIGSRFTGRLIGATTLGPYPAVVPTVRGRAWVTSLATFLLDPDDPYPEGFVVAEP